MCSGCCPCPFHAPLIAFVGVGVWMTPYLGHHLLGGVDHVNVVSGSGNLLSRVGCGRGGSRIGHDIDILVHVVGLLEGIVRHVG